MTHLVRNDVQVPFHGAQLLARKDGEDIFVAVKPICDHLGIAYQPQHRKLVEEGKFNCHHMVMVADDGRQREMLVIERRDLAGWLYSINAKKVGQGLPGAQRQQLQQLLTAYQRESTDALHNYWAGGRGTPPAPAAPALPATYSEALRRLADEVEANQALVLENSRLQPKAEAFERFLELDGTYGVSEVAKIINRPGLGPVKLFELLRERGILMTGGERHNLPYQKYIDAGYFTVRPGERPGQGGVMKPTATTRVLPRGLHWICKNVLKVPLPAQRLDFGVQA